MSGGIGFYVHHHGRGHLNRAQQIISYIDEPVTVFGSSLDNKGWGGSQVKKVLLPIDTKEHHPITADWPENLHYAPLKIPGIRERMFALAQWIRETNPSLLVVDVSVEITLFARLMGVPTVVMRQNGARDDPPHRVAFQSSSGLLAPYPSTLEDQTTPTWVCEKTFYSGGFSRYSDRELTREGARLQVRMEPSDSYVVVMNGMGGSGNPLSSIAKAAQASSSWKWWVVGPIASYSSELPSNVEAVGQVDDTFPYLKGADVVVASAGNNTVMEIATANTPYVCIPEERPFQEQLAKAEALSHLRAARVMSEWPAAAQWSSILDEAQRSDTSALHSIIDREGAQKCARYIMQKANQAVL